MRPFSRFVPIAAALAAVFAATFAVAAETSYFDAKPWGVVLHVPEKGESGDVYCAVQTTLWDNRRISFEIPIGASGPTATAIRLEKSDWQLPLHQTTSVRLEVTPELGFEFPVKAISANELYYVTPPANDLVGTYLVLVLRMVTGPRPASLTAIFGGNEPRWAVPEMDRFQTIQLNMAYNHCEADAEAIQVRATDGDEKGTSPFSAAPPAAAPPVQSPDTERAQAPTEWEFYTRNEDWGLTCFVQTHRGISMVGFMGSPGKDLVGFVSSVFSGETRATWHVDDKQAYVSDGDQSDYFSWYEFGQLPMELLEQIAQGKELAVTGAKGERVVVDLTGASDPISKFKACFTKS